MQYHLSKLVAYSFEEALRRVSDELAREGFGVLTEIDVRATLKKKLELEFRPYRILGACNPRFAHEALGLDDKIGVLLPCNVVVQEHAGGQVEVSAMDPVAVMKDAGEPALTALATRVKDSLQRMLDRL